MFIYRITNIITQDFYVGQTRKTLKRRFAVHKCNARAGVDTHLYRAMRKYGEEHYIIEAIESKVPETLLNERERHYISTLKPQYNMNEGGSSGNSMTTKHQEAMKKYHANKPKEEYATYGSLGTTRDTNARISDTLSHMKPCCVKGRWFFSIQEACDYYQIGRTTYYRWRNKGLVEMPTKERFTYRDYTKIQLKSQAIGGIQHKA